MQIFSQSTWNASTGSSVPATVQFTSSSGKPLLGICIGPDSEDGLVAVNGVTLQAGHVLPICSSSYQITAKSPFAISGVGNPVPGINLQLFGLETEAELLSAADLIRAPRQYDGGVVGVVGPDTQAAFAARPQTTGTLLVTVPFTGRYRCLFQLAIADTTSANFQYAVVGARFSTANDKFTNSIVTVQQPVSRDAQGTVAFYIEDETWDYLQVVGAFIAAPTNATIGVCSTVTAEIQP